jgi:hypothetical protein
VYIQDLDHKHLGGIRIAAEYVINSTVRAVAETLDAALEELVERSVLTES